jgi:xylulokinase
MMFAIQDVPAGSRGVIFTPWLHGNRCPFEDPNARGMFFNINLETKKSDLIHAVLEGICYHLRWQLESQEKKNQNIGSYPAGRRRARGSADLSNTC